MSIRYSVLNLPPLPPPPAPEMGCGGGDKKCRKSKESPPWVCEKCAKKTAEEKRRALMGHEMSCGYETPEEVAARERDAMETSESTLDLGRGEIGCPVCKAKAAKRKNPNETSESTLDLSGQHRMDCMSRPPGAPDETSEASLDLGCDKCQKGKKRRQAAAKQFQDSFPSGWLNISGPMLKQVPIRGMGTEYVYEETSEATLDLGRMPGMLQQVPLRMANGGRGGRSTAWGNDEDEDQVPYGMYGRNPGGMLGQVRIAGLGDGGRGGRSVPYDESFREPFEGYRYCDPSMEICPTPLVGPVGIGIGGRRCTGRHGYLGQGGQAYGCPASAPALDPTLNCQRDARGNAVCSNGMYFPPGCPHTPPEQYFSPGIAPDEVHNGILEAKVPAPRAAGTTGADTGGGAASTTNVLPLAAGGIAALGLLYAIFR